MPKPRTLQPPNQQQQLQDRVFQNNRGKDSSSLSPSTTRDSISSESSGVKWLLLALALFNFVLPLNSSTLPTGLNDSPSTNNKVPDSSDQLCPEASRWPLFCSALLNTTLLNASSIEILIGRVHEAQSQFCDMIRVLNKIDCAQPFTVSPKWRIGCQEAYRDWTCSLLVEEHLPPSLRGCDSNCHQVIRVCPYLSPDRLQNDLTGRPNSHPSQYGGHPAFYCPTTFTNEEHTETVYFEPGYYDSDSESVCILFNPNNAGLNWSSFPLHNISLQNLKFTYCSDYSSIEEEEHPLLNLSAPTRVHSCCWTYNTALPKTYSHLSATLRRRVLEDENCVQLAERESDSVYLYERNVKELEVLNKEIWLQCSVSQGEVDGGVVEQWSIDTDSDYVNDERYPPAVDEKELDDGFEFESLRVPGGSGHSVPSAAAAALLHERGHGYTTTTSTSHGLDSDNGEEHEGSKFSPDTADDDDTDGEEDDEDFSVDAGSSSSSIGDDPEPIPLSSRRQGIQVLESNNYDLIDSEYEHEGGGLIEATRRSTTTSHYSSSTTSLRFLDLVTSGSSINSHFSTPEARFESSRSGRTSRNSRSTNTPTLTSQKGGSSVSHGRKWAASTTPSSSHSTHPSTTSFSASGASALSCPCSKQRRGINYVALSPLLLITSCLLLLLILNRACIGKCNTPPPSYLLPETVKSSESKSQEKVVLVLVLISSCSTGPSYYNVGKWNKLNSIRRKGTRSVLQLQHRKWVKSTTVLLQLLRSRREGHVNYSNISCTAKKLLSSCTIIKLNAIISRKLLVKYWNGLAQRQNSRRYRVISTVCIPCYPSRRIRYTSFQCSCRRPSTSSTVLPTTASFYTLSTCYHDDYNSIQQCSPHYLLLARNVFRRPRSSEEQGFTSANYDAPNKSSCQIRTVSMIPAANNTQTQLFHDYKSAELLNYNVKEDLSTKTNSARSSSNLST